MEWLWDTDGNKLLSGRELQPLAKLFPSLDPSDGQVVLDLLPLDTARRLDNAGTLRPPDYFSKEACLIIWRGTQLAVPYRLSIQEPASSKLPGLSGRQKQLLPCLYLRPYNGYVRQRHLEALLALSAAAPADFTTPFTFSRLGEYVQEILEVTAANLTPALLASYVALLKENPLYWQQTQGRVASYWDVYYRAGRRGAPRFQHYVGARLLAQLHAAPRQMARS